MSNFNIMNPNNTISIDSSDNEMDSGADDPENMDYGIVGGDPIAGGGGSTGGIGAGVLLNEQLSGDGGGGGGGGGASGSDLQTSPVKKITKTLHNPKKDVVRESVVLFFLFLQEIRNGNITIDKDTSNYALSQYMAASIGMSPKTLRQHLGDAAILPSTSTSSVITSAPASSSSVSVDGIPSTTTINRII